MCLLQSVAMHVSKSMSGVKQVLTTSVQPATRAQARWKCCAQLRSAHFSVAPFWLQWLQRVARPRLTAPGRCICNHNKCQGSEHTVSSSSG